MTRVAVFCGSSAGVRPEYAAAAFEVGRRLALAGFGLVYGGGGVGMMGALSDGALAADGEVIGVIPQAMVDREWGRHDITELRVVDSMHARKALMYSLADAFVILPGGLGTWDEFFEVATWRQIGLHDQRIVILTVGGYGEALADLLQSGLEEGFVPRESFHHLDVVDSIDELFAVLRDE